MRPTLAASLTVNAVGAAGLAVLLKQRWQKRHRSFASEANALFVAPPPEGSIVFAGDSHVEYAPLLDLLTDYRQRGIGGQKIADVRSWIRELTREPVSHLVLVVGTNDIHRGRTPAQAAADYKDLLDDVAGHRVTILGIPPIRGKEDQAAELNRLLTGLAQERDHAFVPLDTTLLGTDWTTDGIHLTPAAYQRLGPTLRRITRAG